MKKWKDLVAKMPPDRQEKIRNGAENLRKAMALYEVREARCITQNHLAELLQVDQSAISKMEKRTDMYISTLTHFIEAMGGQLEIRAIFPEGEVKIKQFKELAAS